MKYIIKILTGIYLIVFCSTVIVGQNTKIDSLNLLIETADSDTSRIQLIVNKVELLSTINLDSAIDLAVKTLPEIKKIKFYRTEVDLRQRLVYNYAYKGNFTAASEQISYLAGIIIPGKDSADIANVYASKGLVNGMQSKYDTSIYYFEIAIGIYERNGIRDRLGGAYSNIAIGYQQQSNFPMALVYQQKSLNLCEEDENIHGQAYATVNMANTYTNLGDVARSESTYLKAIDLAQKTQLQNVELYAYTNLSTLYSDEGNWQNCYEFAMKAVDLGGKMGDQGIQAASLSKASRAKVFMNQEKIAEALAQRAISIADSSGQPFNISQAYGSMGFVLLSLERWKKAIPYYEKSFESLKDTDLYNSGNGVMFKELADCYEKTGAYSKALDAFKQSAIISDSVRSRENIKKATELTMKYEFEKKEQSAKAKQEAKDQVTQARQLALIISLILSFVLIIGAFFGYYNKRKDNALLKKQKKEIENTLEQLKNTQTQLIQSEKMASLGELTAGIAHEIQNPLNFVNNFSEVSKDLLAEMKEELDEGNAEDAKEIAIDVIQNLEKIIHHGKRADEIVKGMLQHSKSSGNTRENTDINALAEEYLRLTFHGIQAKDDSFHAEFKTELDPSLPEINLVPQDIGRVLLNLINNAFYAVSAEAKAKEDPSYKPLVIVSTKNLSNTIEIRVEDNGSGIPEEIKAKIFQPFFTTKPTGQGTGLGLSLSYDIIKAHGGELKVESIEGKETVFIINIPV